MAIPRRILTIVIGIALFGTAACTVAPVRPEPAAAAAPTERVPLGDALAGLEPQDVWQNFYAITQIPRPSGHVEQMRDYLVQFGAGLGLETSVDEAGNVLIRKPAAPGLEGRAGVVLQAHMDMVAVKTPESAHDFLADPIPAFVAGEWLVSNGTTLGADDGIGMALAMAALQAETPTGPIEALFTVDEETTMAGATGLPPGVLQGSYLINLDQEQEGEFLIGSAGGVTADVAAGYALVAAPEGLQGYEVAVGGLTGGHSGVDIDKGRGNAIKLLVRLLRDTPETLGLRLAALEGGTAPNSIAAHAVALVGVPEAQADAFLEAVRSVEETVKTELAAAEPGLSVTATPAALPAQVMGEGDQRRLIAALDASPQGVQRMSDAVAGLVETSLNLGVVQARDGEFLARWALRSAVDTALDDTAARLAGVWRLAGEEVVFSSAYPGWAPDPGSSLVQLMEQTYADIYGKEAVTAAIHAGLECGTVISKYPGMEAISIGPTLRDVHSVSERLEIATVQAVADLLAETLNRIPE